MVHESFEVRISLTVMYTAQIDHASSPSSLGVNVNTTVTERCSHMCSHMCSYVLITRGYLTTPGDIGHEWEGLPGGDEATFTLPMQDPVGQ